MKIQTIFFIFIIFLIFSGCENPMMFQFLEPKTITFDTNGGSPVQPQTLYKNERISQPREPIKNWYIFEGWYTDNYYGIRWDFNDIPKGDMTLYAAWLDQRKPTPSYNDFYIEGVEKYLYNGEPKMAAIFPMQLFRNVETLPAYPYRTALPALGIALLPIAPALPA
jgi:uncharacterized repeat protein (TIGR02543 family)